MQNNNLFAKVKNAFGTKSNNAQKNGFVCACACNKGKVRSTNQDNYYFDSMVLPEQNDALNENLRAYYAGNQTFAVGVFDGMGGEKHGEMAAYIAADYLKNTVEQWGDNLAESMTELCLTANEAICTLADNMGGVRIGCTLALMYFYNDTAWVCNIGDSKIFVYKNNNMLQLSQDHTDEKFLKNAGISRKPALTQHLGIWPDEMLIEPYINTVQIQEDDIYLLCSDGLTDMMNNEEIRDVLREFEDVNDVVNVLINTSLERGGKDNITIIMVKVLK